MMVISDRGLFKMMIDVDKALQLAKKLGVSTEQVLATYSDFAIHYDDEKQIFELTENAIIFLNAAKI